ncbi:MAG: rhombosortase [Burkholderiaceae bacterium]|nr:rhombosortase [Burkholderiaceae bacterium]
MSAWVGASSNPFDARPGTLGWWTVAACLALGSLAAWWVDAGRLDWQPDLAATQPWRWWSGAWVHWSWGHLAANLAGTALIGALGARAHADRADAWAWFVAWPITQLGLQLQPALLHYGGLSGVLHAGVVIAAIGLVQRESGLRRGVGALILAGVALKVGLEQPWQGPLREVAGWSIAIAPAAHLSGAVAGLCCGLAAAAWRRRAARGSSPDRSHRHR